MLTALLLLNFTLALAGFAIAWHLWQWRNALSQAADALLEADRVTHALLDQSSGAIIEGGQYSAQGLRQSYRQLARQIRRLQQVWGMVRFGQRWLIGPTGLGAGRSTSKWRR
ncbi:MAG: hypothetical protein RLZZ511_712 [Cyanobacteriota bacterium]|jgi:hypothetical protein